MLKKLPPPLSHLAREATRWLDQQFERNAPQIAAAASSTPDSRRELRLTAQPESASLEWEDIATSFTSPLTSDDMEPLKANDTPRFFQPILQCALYYATKYDGTKHGPTPPIFVIAHPSEQVRQATQHLSLSNSNSPQPPARTLPNETKVRPTFNAAERADGILAQTWAELFGLSIKEIDAHMVAEAKEKFKEWQRGQQQPSASERSPQKKGRPAGAIDVKPPTKTLFVP